MDMKSAFVKPLSTILRRVNHCSFVSCIGESRDHIHQGQIITIKYHPLLYEALLLVLEADASTLGPKKNYMLFCKQMYGIIQRELVCKDKKICCGDNITSKWGTIHLFQENFDRGGIVSIIDPTIRMTCDGHKSYMKGDRIPVFIVRCLKWAREIRKRHKINIQQIATVSDIELKKIFEG